jgi:hypothetical protein
MGEIPAFALDFPAGIPPEGVIPNHINPKSTGNTLIVASSVLLGIMMGFVFNRIYVKTCIARRFSWDDGRFLQPPIFCMLTGGTSDLLHWCSTLHYRS